MSQVIPTEFATEFTPGNLKAAMSGAGASSGDLWRVPVDKFFRVPGLNVRTKNEEYAAHVTRLAKSMFEEGFYQDKPIAVYIDGEGRICVKDGYSRLDAVDEAISMGANIVTLPAVTAPKGTTMTDIMVGLVKSNTGKPLLPIEVAVVCKRLLGWGWTAAAIAERLDYTPAYVNNLVGLLEAPAALQSLVSAGKTSASTAIKQIKKEGAAKATETLTKASAGASGGKVSPKMLKAPAGKTAAELSPEQMLSIIQSVFDDPMFAKLGNKLQDKIAQVFE